MTFDCETLGPYLKRERERLGVSLDQISDTTKIKRSLLAGLERGDVAKWPSGIFRRAFFRAYLSAVGLDADVLVPEFVRLFPDAVEGDTRPSISEEPSPLRLTLADESLVVSAARSRVGAAALDTAAIAVAAAAVGLPSGHLSLAAALVAVLYHALVTASGGRGLGAWLTRRHGVEPRRAALEQPAPRLEARRLIETGRRGRMRRRAPESSIARGTHAVS